MNIDNEKKMRRSIASNSVETSTISLDYLKALKGCSMTGKWDVVSFVLLDKINSLWKKRWDAETADAFNGDRTFVQSIDVTFEQNPSHNQRIVYQLNAKLGPPSLEFLLGNSMNVIVIIPLVSGTMTTTTYYKGNLDETNSINIQSTVEKPLMLTANALLAYFDGGVDDFHHVHIDLKQMDISLKNIKFDPLVDKDLCNVIEDYIQKQKLQPWLLGTLRYHSDKEFLKPKHVKFRTFVPPNEHMHISNADYWPPLLGIYIVTTSEIPSGDIDKTWGLDAWPVSKELDAAVYFSAKLFFENEVIPEMKKTFGNASIVFDEKTKTYSATVGNPILVINKDIEYIESVGAVNILNPAKKVNRRVKISLPAMSIKLKLNMNNVELSCHKTWSESIPCQDSSHTSQGGSHSSYSVSNKSFEFSCSFDSLATAKINKDTFVISFDTCKLKPAISMHNNEGWLENLAGALRDTYGMEKEAENGLLNQFKDKELILGEMSMFAVSNLLFPESKCIEPEAVCFPNDLVIVGKVTRDWKKPA
ncbi:MAG: hypothetical protein WCI11_19240 [Candidatus Methylumidiphilus sp.]